MLKFLRSGTSRPSSRAGSPSRSPRTLRIQINVPSYGGVFMTHHHNERNHDTASIAREDPSVHPEFFDRELSGEVEIEVPRGMGRRRCRAIRVKLRNVARLNMGPERGWEEDVLFERSIEVKGAIILEEGVQRFNFTIVVPFALAPYDVHPNGSIKLHLIAEVEGLGGRNVLPFSAAPSPAPSPAGTPRRGRSPVRQPSNGSNMGNGGHSGGSSGAATPSGSGSHTPPDDDMYAPSTPIATQMVVSWSDPVASLSAGLANAESEVKWLRGTVSEKRLITLLYNPEPNNGVSTLDERRRGDVDALGPFDVRYTSDIWSICAVLRTQVTIEEPAAAVTIFYARICLQQTYAIKSPRDDEETMPTVHPTTFVICERGLRPPAARPSPGTPALWRGTAAGGKDTGAFTISTVGRLPNDENGRPSTLDGVITPIHTEHSLVFELWYSVYNEDVQGNPLPKPGQGPLRLLKVDRPVIVPSCAFIPEVLELPSYESHQFEDAPCPVCKTPAEQQACRTCLLTAVPHARHDLPPSLVGNENGICPRCEKRFITDDCTGKWADCACGMSLQQLEKRMRAVALDDAADSGQTTPTYQKETQERDRGRQR